MRVAIEKRILKMIAFRNDMKKAVSVNDLHDAAIFEVSSKESMLNKASSIGVLSTPNEDVRSLREMIIYGIKGIAAYAEHAKKYWERRP